MIPLQKNSKFTQGLYIPRNPDKYVGVGKLVYRSSYELKFMRWADANPNVLKWSSESLVIPYRSPIDGKIHRYHVDNMVVIKEGDVVKKYIVEIKPYKQTLKPSPSKKKKRETILYEQATYDVNLAKWEAAKEWCKNRDWKFIILTERDLF